MPDEENIFNLFKEILTVPVLYNKQGVGDFFYFLHLNKLDRKEFLDIVYKNFNNYPDYNGKNSFICPLLMNINFMHDSTGADYDTFLYFMARLYLNTTEEKRGIIEIMVFDEKLEKMIRCLETIQ